MTVENVFRTYFVPWPSIEGIDTRYSLTIHTRRGAVAGVGDAGSRPPPRARDSPRKDFDGIGETARGEHGSLRPERRPEHAVAETSRR